MERRIWFIEEGPEGRCTTHPGTAARWCNPTAPTGSGTHTLRDYSRHLHFSTSARLPLNSLAVRHSSASSEIWATTSYKDGMAPSKTMSFRWRQRHQHTRVMAVHRSRSFPGPPPLLRLEPRDEACVRMRHPMELTPPSQTRRPDLPCQDAAK
jgi:hypothetical protein